MFNYAVLGNGEDPVGYHLLNLLLHLCNVLLVWALARRLGGPRWPAAWVAALWAVHPILTESVTNIVGRADLLAAMAILAGLWIHIRSRETTGLERVWWLAALLAVTTIGAFSKESAVTVLGVIVLYEVTCGDALGRRRALMRSIAVVAAPIAVMLYARWRVLGASAPTDFPFADNPIVGAGFWEGRLTALKVMAKYAGLLVWPVGLSCDYSYTQIPLVEGAGLWTGAAVTVALAVGAVPLWRWSRMGFFLAASAFLVFLPGANLLFPIGTIMAERFLYVPAIAFAAGVVWLVWFRLGRAAPIVLGAAILALGGRTFARNADWHDELSLATATVRVSPASFKAHKMRANALLESDPSHGNIAAVIDEAEKSLAILDGLPADRTNTDMYRRASGYYFMKGDRSRVHNADGSYMATAESVTAYRKALDLLERSGADSEGEAEKAKLYLRLGEREKAMEAALRARTLNPQSADIYRLIAGLEVDAGRDEGAVVALMEGVLVTRDAGLTQKLAELYRGGLDPQGCAITAEGALNPRCPAVRRDLCKAVSEVVKLPRRADIGDFGCEAENH